MRRESIAWFGAGIIVGVVSLYLVLWSGGVLSPYLSQVRAESRTQQLTTREQPSSARRPAQQAVPTGPAPARSTPIAVPARTEPIVLPIEGLKASDIQDTYDQGRSQGRMHEAIDIMAPRGTPVHAMVDGVIQKLFTSKAGGLTIYQFDKPAEYCYYYAHLDRYADGIQQGMEVARGTVIGYVGSTGDAAPNAPHLHLGISVIGPHKAWWKTTPVNPYPILMNIAK